MSPRVWHRRTWRRHLYRAAAIPAAVATVVAAGEWGIGWVVPGGLMVWLLVAMSLRSTYVLPPAPSERERPPLAVVDCTAQGEYRLWDDAGGAA